MTANAVNVVDSTQNTMVMLPFPSPYSFGSASKSCVLYNSTLNRYTMFVLTYQPSQYFDDSCIDLTVQCHSNSDNIKWNYATFTVDFTFSDKDIVSSAQNTIRVASCQLYRFNWTVGSARYTCSQVTLTGTDSPWVSYKPNGEIMRLQYVYGTSSSDYDWECTYSQPFNGTRVRPVSPSSISYSFSSSDGGQILSILNGMSSTLDSVDTGIDNVNNKLNSTNDLLNAVNNNVVFYCQQILERLDNGSDYVPEQTTSNSDMSNYEQAEGALMDDNIDKLNNIEMPDLNSFNSGSQNNAFKFISSNIEFFSGMNGTGSVAKIATVLVVILGLGLASFIIGLSNRRKGG